MGQPARQAWIVAIAASAGGLPAIIKVLEGLPGDFPAAVLVLMHMEPTRASTQLARIFQRATALHVEDARDGARLLNGRVYVCVPNHHLILLSKRTIGLSMAAPVHFLRPSADVMFESLAAHHSTNVIAVVLSGTGRDGAAGAVAIEKAGGVVLVQNEESAHSFGMPGATIAHVNTAQAVPLDSMSTQILSLVVHD